MAEATKSRDGRLLITNPKTKVTYLRGNFLGKGGFAKCYELENTQTGEVFAGKVVSKSMLMKPNHKEKMFQEIQIHCSLSHKYIVTLHSYFEDESNVYIVLELCSKRSLMEMHKRRKTLTLPEVRYFMRQIVLGVKYLHENKVIHRDLKLGNLFINNEMDIKIGDFGLATRISFDGERKKTLCGTPNYIAPEILTKMGHSYEVDIWSLGCIMYTLLVGTPPFETKTLKTTYSKIKKNEYYIPPTLDKSAKDLIRMLLHADAIQRPNADHILQSEFLTSGYIPSRLPTSCLSMEPRTSQNISVCELSKAVGRKPLANNENVPKVPATEKLSVANKADKLNLQGVIPEDFYLGDLLKMVESVVGCHPETIYQGQSEDAQDPSAVPFVWISKWIDYSDKYGLGYQLCDNSIGVFFNDNTHLVLLADEKNFQFVDSKNEEMFYTLENYPPEIRKKVTILDYFKAYMNENLIKTGESARPREGDEMTHEPHLRAWFRTKHAIIFHLTNGTFQANFFKDHTKIILCPVMGAVSFIDEDKNFTVYTFKLIQKYGCPNLLASRLNYARQMIDRLFKELK